MYAEQKVKIQHNYFGKLSGSYLLKLNTYRPYDIATLSYIYTQQICLYPIIKIHVL